MAFKPYVNGLPADLPLPTQKNYTTSYALAKADHVWDVTNAEEEVDAPAGAFSTATVKHAIIILDKKTGGTKINAAYVWDIDPDDLIAGLTVTASADKAKVTVDGTLTLTATVTGGTAPYTYVWKRDGVVLSGKTTSEITLTGAELGTASETAKVFSVTVTDVDGKTKTGYVNVTVSATPAGLTLTHTNGTDFTVYAGSSLTALTWKVGRTGNFVEIPDGTATVAIKKGTDFAVGTYWESSVGKFTKRMLMRALPFLSRTSLATTSRRPLVPLPSRSRFTLVQALPFRIMLLVMPSWLMLVKLSMSLLARPSRLWLTLPQELLMAWSIRLLHLVLPIMGLRLWPGQIKTCI